MNSIFSPAKINLALHVVGQNAQRYHLLQSLSVFADIGDTVQWQIAPRDSLRITGPYASILQGHSNNLLTTALNLVRTHYPVPPLALHLHKNLPVAAGIGGGSGNAAALLRGLQAQYNIAWPQIQAWALQLGADVPMCLHTNPVWATGIGEQLTPIQQWPRGLGIVLIRPNIAVPTAAVFAALTCKNNPPTSMPTHFNHAADLRQFLQSTRNDLTAPAQQIAPILSNILAHLQNYNNNTISCGLSGSGATCFVLCHNSQHAHLMALKLQCQFVDCWIKAGVIL